MKPSVAIPTLIIVIGFLSILLSVSACFAPDRSANLSCSDDGLCPNAMICDTDNICRTTALADGSPGDARENIDAAIPIDATPVQCTSNAECVTPPNLCLFPGECNLDTNLCSFPSVVCNAPDVCATHSCNPGTGACEMSATNEGTTCDSGTTCDAFGDCDFPAGACENNGTQSRDCVDRTCQDGTCSVSPTRVEVQDCMRDTSGDTCSATTCGSFGQCGGFDPTNLVCDQSGTHTRICTDFQCASGSCISADRNDPQPCLRNTAGLTCGLLNQPFNATPQDRSAALLEGCCIAGNCLDIGLGCDPI